MKKKKTAECFGCGLPHIGSRNFLSRGILISSFFFYPRLSGDVCCHEREVEAPPAPAPALPRAEKTPFRAEACHVPATGVHLKRCAVSRFPPPCFVTCITNDTLHKYNGLSFIIFLLCTSVVHNYFPDLLLYY